MGLEPVGEVPPLESMPPGEVLAALEAFRQSVKTQLLVGYFVTKDMRSDLERSALRGVTPILLSTVAMMGGEVESVGGISAGGNPGVEMQYYDAGGMRHTAYYVAGDLSNSGFKGGYRNWVAGLGGKATYFKAASYLMYDDRFSQAREFFLSQSRAILQDDSGIPFRYFAQGSWSFRFFGNYREPHRALRGAPAGGPAAGVCVESHQPAGFRLRLPRELHGREPAAGDQALIARRNAPSFQLAERPSRATTRSRDGRT